MSRSVGNTIQGEAATRSGGDTADSNIQGETCLTNLILGSNDGDGDVVCWGKLCLLGEVTDDKRQQIC